MKYGRNGEKWRKQNIIRILDLTEALNPSNEGQRGKRTRVEGEVRKDHPSN